MCSSDLVSAASQIEAGSGKGWGIGLGLLGGAALLSAAARDRDVVYVYDDPYYDPYYDEVVFVDDYGYRIPLRGRRVRRHHHRDHHHKHKKNKKK